MTDFVTKIAAIGQLLEAKRHSDRGDYGRKHQILRQLIAKNPKNWIIDQNEGRFPGLTHTPSGFRMHAPRDIASMIGPEADEPLLMRMERHIDALTRGNRAARTLGVDRTQLTQQITQERSLPLGTETAPAPSIDRKKPMETPKPEKPTPTKAGASPLATLYENFTPKTMQTGLRNHAISFFKDFDRNKRNQMLAKMKSQMSNIPLVQNFVNSAPATNFNATYTPGL